MTKLYHRDVFVPAGIASAAGWLGRSLTYSRHALEEAVKDQLTYLPPTVPEDAQLIEIEVVDDHITKWVLRWYQDPARDLVAVVLPDGFVKTVWTNWGTDQHKSLNRNRYARD